jgi:acyl-CoA thioesterase FadM
MQVLDEAPVLESEIDSLGHMNVRFYIARVDRANAVLLQQLGIKIPADQKSVLRRADTYSRFHREQFSGSQLQVHGGLLDISPAQIRCYYEIRNPDKDQVAATFITVSQLIQPASQTTVPFSLAGVTESEQYKVELPDYGSPRSLTLNPPKVDVALTELQARITSDPAPGMMSGSRSFGIETGDCDANGYLQEDIDLMFIMHRAQSLQKGETFGPPIMKTDNGHRFSWAMIETRAVVLGRPRAGDELLSIGADIAYGERWRQSRRWAFVKDTGVLVGINDVVGIALDLDERKSIHIPDAVRQTIEETYLPDLA